MSNARVTEYVTIAASIVTWQSNVTVVTVALEIIVRIDN